MPSLPFGASTFATPIIASRVTSSANRRLAETVGSGRPFRQHQIADLGGRIPYPHFDLVRQAPGRTRQHAARVDHRARPIRRRLVPARRQAEQTPRIAGAERADDEVMDGGRVLDHHDDAAPRARGIRSGSIVRVRVLQQPRLEVRIDPGPRDDLRAAPRADLLFIGLDPGVDRGGIDQPLLRQQALQRLGAQRRVGRHVAVRVIARMVVVMRMIGQAMRSRKPRTLAAPS